jgi:hypothetical protein
MNIDALIPEVEEARKRGATVLLKWDGERSVGTCTVVLSYAPADWFWRRDTDSPAISLAEGLSEFKIVLASTPAGRHQSS